MADTEALVNELKDCADKLDFERAFRLVRDNKEALASKLQAVGIRDVLRRSTKDRLLLSFIDGCGFGEVTLGTALVNLEKLLSFELNSLVLNSTWGLGKVKKLDYFYRRITVDFKSKPGHQFVYSAAVDMLKAAPENHILVLRESDKGAFDDLLKSHKGAFVKRVLESNGGSMSLIKLENYCVNNGFVKSSGWKKFWEEARAELKSDQKDKKAGSSSVVIPVKKTDPILLVKTDANDFGDSWLTAFAQSTDPKMILASVNEYDEYLKKINKDANPPVVLDGEIKAKIEDRMSFAITAMRKVDDALYVRLACKVAELGLEKPSTQEMRDYLWERKRFIKAAAALPARDVGNMIKFLANSEEACEKLYAAIPDFCYTAVTEIIRQFGDRDACRKAVADLFKQPKAPATLITLVVGKYISKDYDFNSWAKASETNRNGMPKLITILAHAIALGEGRQSGETLKMQNIVRRLFGTENWLKEMFNLLDADEKKLFFERFQASIAWDPSTHHTVVIRMTKIQPELVKLLVQVEKKREYARVTSPRSYAQRKAEYQKLINVDMPENVRKIEFAKGFGDLSENAEYQYAKDEQRVLMQKQATMQADLNAVKPDSFENASVEEVMPGVTVLVNFPDGEREYTILGEWDNDFELKIISSKAGLATNMLGKKVGDQFELPGESPVKYGTIVQIKPLSDAIREWMNVKEV